MTRDEFPAKIDEAYRYRVAGDVDAIRSMFTTDGIFGLGGARVPLKGVLNDEPSAIVVLSALIESYTFRKVQRLGGLVEGNKVAVLSRAEIAPAGGKAHSVELFDLFSIGPDGRFTSFMQFVDAGFIATPASQRTTTDARLNAAERGRNKQRPASGGTTVPIAAFALQ